MSQPLVLVDARIPDGPLAPLSARAELVRYAGDAELDALLERRGAEVVGLGPLLTTLVDALLLARMPNLRIVANYAVGFDNVDRAAAAGRGIVVTHTPDVLTEATADLTWALILAVARRVPQADRLARSGRWEGWDPRQLRGAALQGRTLGILGLGRIGSAVARRAPGFGMRVAAWSRSRRPELERDLGLEPFDLDALLGHADVLSVHLPLTEATDGLLGAERLARLKPGAILVNTARGRIVDEAALADALAAGRLWGAGLDVYADEPRIHPALVASERTVLLPHLGSATREARDAMAALVADNLLAVLEGKAAPTPVPGPER